MDTLLAIIPIVIVLSFFFIVFSSSKVDKARRECRYDYECKLKDVQNKGYEAYEKQLKATEEQIKAEYEKKLKEVEDNCAKKIIYYENLNRELSLKLDKVNSRYAIFKDAIQYTLNYSADEIFKDIGGVSNYIKAYCADFSVTEFAPDFSCKVHSGDKIYDTSLKSCTCPAYTFDHSKPCKHMVYLAMQYGFLCINKADEQQAFKNLHKLSKKIADEKDEIEKDRQESKRIKESAHNIIKSEKAKLDKIKADLDEREKILQETAQNYPGAAKVLQHYSDELDKYRESCLLTQAFKARKIVNDIKKEKRQIQYERDLYFAQLATYESLFPWLEEFKEVPIPDAMSYIADIAASSQDENEYFRGWLSPDEFASLTASEKLQRKLDRWNARKKSDWEAGIEYERYIGYLCEQDGYSVEYSGALNGLGDMGRDLVITKGRTAVVIQCKRWKQNKQIHENHIFQLFGTGILYSLQHPEKNVKTAFLTTGSLSDIAEQCAERLSIAVVHQNMAGYPLIKCNINRSTGDKIYHLPFDQQYDSTAIEINKGECYAHTIAEAEEKGFRHAFRWRG